ncbi:ubiquitin-like protein [Tothia fuscella]|uniref:Ubiquitin-like modifier HUB1 n=1 Tax=Tothia fuscella TaxID=1048955 RepID=A0A9P4TYC2_9PEZI|nr:ubiquitin-like protein [Tothia fuscella]
MTDVISQSRSQSPRRSPAPEIRRERSGSRSRDTKRRRSTSAENITATESSTSKGKTRSRSRSPPRGPKKSNNSKGFKWKSQSRDDSGQGRDRGGRDFRDRDAYQSKRYGGGRDECERDRGGERRRDYGWDSKVDDKFGGGRDRDSRKQSDRGGDDKFSAKTERKERDDKPPARAAAVSTATAEYIIVTVNDRLGTKASIPCLASDSVGDFKKMVAAHIGRKPHEIMLKRQGERPFKDMLSLEDYGVSSGVQLDLELDTGD